MKPAAWGKRRRTRGEGPNATGHGRRWLSQSALYSLTLMAVTSAAFAQVETKLLSNDPQPGCGAGFGRSVALEGGTAVGGASFFNCGPGGAIVFEQNGGVWTQQAELTAQGFTSDEFGAAIALSGQTIVVGSPDDNIVGFGTGSAYVYVFNGSSWVQQQRLTASDMALNDFFGNAVAISGDTIVVGAWLDNASAVDDGSAYVFVRQAGVWTQDAKLTANFPATGDHFGATVGISGSTIVVGVPSDNETQSNSGAAYIFVRDVKGWTRQQKLKPTVPVTDADFGAAVVIDGSRIIVGEPMVDSKTGAAYIFEWSGSIWFQQARLTPSDGDPDDTVGDLFGDSVALSGGTAVIGATQNGGFTILPGAAYVFAGGGAAWNEVIKLTASDGVAGDVFAASVSVSGFNIVVGAAGDNNENGPGDGAIYIYDLDCNGNGTFDAQEIADGTSDDCDLNNIPDECEPDCNGNGFTDACDLATRYFAFVDQGSQVYQLDPSDAWSATLFCDLASEGIVNVTAADTSRDGFLHVLGGTPQADTLYKIDLWDNCRLLQSWTMEGPTEAIAFSPSGLLYFVVDGNTFKTFDLARGIVIDEFASTAFEEVKGADFTDDGRLFAIAGFDGAGHDFNQILEIDPTTGGVISTSCSFPASAPLDIHSLDINLAGEFHAVTTEAGDAPASGVFSINSGACFATSLGSTSFAFGALASVQSRDCNANDIPDECEPDCNANGVVDECDLDPDDPDLNGAFSEDCNFNAVPDECDADPTDPDGNGSVSGDCDDDGVLDECVGGETITYDILVADLINMTDCDNGSFFGGANPKPGFSWIDATPTGVLAVQIEFNVGVECHSVGAVHATSLNGIADASFVSPRVFCDCSATLGTPASVEVDPGSYVRGGANTFLFTNLSTMFGVTPNAAWGSGVYARVTVQLPAIPEDCNTNGRSDACDIRDGDSSDGNANDIPDDCELTGDLDGNGLVNLTDYGQIAFCMTGICGVPPCVPALYANPLCALIDTDNDGDVDLLNIAEFQNVFTGP